MQFGYGDTLIFYSVFDCNILLTLLRTFCSSEYLFFSKWVSSKPVFYHYFFFPQKAWLFEKCCIQNMLDNTEDRLTHLPKSPRHVPLISILHPPVKVDPSQRRKVPDILPVFPTKWDFRTQTLSEVYRHCNCTEWTQVANGHSCSGNLRLACCPNPGSRQRNAVALLFSANGACLLPPLWFLPSVLSTLI